jgi:hypothetical protein
MLMFLFGELRSRRSQMVSEGVFTVLVWLLGPVSALLGGGLIVYWLLDEVRKGFYASRSEPK